MATRVVTADDEAGLLQDAIAETEAEIFAEANGAEAPERSGDKSLEEMGDGLEGEKPVEEEPETESEQVEPEGDKEAVQVRDEKGQFSNGKGVPPGRLREEREKRTAAESAIAERDRQLADLRREFDALKTGLGQRQQPQQQEQPKQEVPDMFAEPEKWQQHVMASAQQQARALIVESSLSDAADTHGEKFQQAYDELQRLGSTEKQQFGSSPTVNRIWSSPNPGKALMNWHQQQATIREVGSDPNVWLEKKLEERLNDPDFLAKAIERAKGSARQGDQGRPRNVTRMPPSLNGQSGSTHQVSDPDMYDPSEASVFAFATR